LNNLQFCFSAQHLEMITREI